jgi:two-component system, NtrC family, sensor kinase
MKVDPDENKLHQRLQSARERLQGLYKRAEASPAERALLEDALTELSITLEELRVSFEELHQSTEQLGAAREETAAEQRRYRELFDFAPTGYLVTDPWGNIEDGNRLAQALLGLRHDQLARKPMIIFIVEKDHRAFRDLLTKLLTGEVSEEWQTIISRKHDGDASFPATLNVFRVCDQQGRLIRLLWLVRDITERKKADDLVRTGLRRVTALREINTTIMSTLDLQQILDFLLEKIEGFFPYPIATTVRLFNRDKRLEYLAVRNIKDEDWKDYKPVTPGLLGQEVLRTKTPLVVRNIQTDGRIVRRPEFYRRNNLVSYLAAPLITRDEVLGLLCIYTKEEHEFGKEEIAFLSGVASQAALAIYNSQIYEQLKEKSVELQKAHDELEQRVEERTADLMKVNHDLRFEIAERRRVEDELRRSEERLRDLTKQLEGQLIISDRLVSLGELAASFAHEFNNPLAIILGLSQEMRAELERSHPHYESIASIEQEALRCRKIVLDLLDFVRPREATFIPVDVDEILQKAVSLLTVQHKKSNIKTLVDVKPDLPRILADPQQLQQVLINLCFNAVEAMPQGGSLALRAMTNPAAAAELEGNNHACREVTIAISDTGPGIEPEVLPDIFRPFLTTKKGKGMGLGLSICERIMKTHSGRIRVESTPGKGTTFYLHFPVAEARE